MQDGGYGDSDGGIAKVPSRADPVYRPTKVGFTGLLSQSTSPNAEITHLRPYSMGESLRVTNFMVQRTVTVQVTLGHKLLWGRS